MRLTDKEQVEMLQEWWKDYGKAIAIAVVVGLAIGFGWRYFRQHKVEHAEKASVIYQAMLTADSKKEYATAQQYATELVQRYNHTPYADMASLTWAREAVLQNNYQLALTQLHWVIDNSKIPTLKQIARLRASRVLLAQNKSQEALNVLKIVNDLMYQPLIDQIKGDAYAALGNHKASTASYQSAQTGLLAAGMEDPLLNMKLARP